LRLDRIEIVKAEEIISAAMSILAKRRAQRMTPEERSAQARLAGSARRTSLPEAKRREVASSGAAARWANVTRTPEQQAMYEYRKLKREAKAAREEGK
jgi:hypothetical protein